MLVLVIPICLRATKTRSVPAVIYYILPLIGLIPLRNMIPLPNPSLVWAVFPLAYFTGVFLGYWLQRTYLISKEGGQVTLTDERFTLVSILTLFGFSFFYWFG